MEQTKHETARQIALKLTLKVPRISKATLSAVAKVLILLHREPPSSFFFLANRLNHRVHTLARLGNGMPIKVVWNDRVGLEIIQSGFHDADNVQVLAQFMKPGMIFFDVGAHIGQYTLVASQAGGPTGRIHSFEPDPESFVVLKHNLRINDLNNVKANQTALFSKKDNRKFFISWPEFMGGNSLWCESGEWPGRVFDVSCDTLDDYVCSQGVSRIDVMKVDVEGGEVDLLLGAKTALGGEIKPAILIEFNGPALVRAGHTCSELAELLQDLGYSLFHISNSQFYPALKPPADNTTTDCLALPKTDSYSNWRISGSAKGKSTEASPTGESS